MIYSCLLNSNNSDDLECSGRSFIYCKPFQIEFVYSGVMQCAMQVSRRSGLLVVLNVMLSLAASQPLCSLLQPGCVNTTEVDIKKTCRTSKLNNRQNGRVSLSRFFF